MIKAFIILFSLIFTSSSFAVETPIVKGKVKTVFSFSESYNPYREDSRTFFGAEIEGMPGACGNDSFWKRFLISTDHPAYQTVVSIVLLAKASDLEVRVAYTGECTLRENSWDFGWIELVSH